MNVSDHQEIFIGSSKILEPIVAVTSFLVTVCAIGLFYKSGKNNLQLSEKFYRWFILLIGIGTLLGGLFGHGFNYYLDIPGKFPSRIIGIIAVSIAGQAALIRARDLLNLKYFRFLTVLNFIECVILAAITFLTQDFIFVEIHTAIIIIAIVFLIESIIYIRIKSILSLNILMGIGCLVPGILYQAFKIHVSDWFSYKDFGHFMEILCLYFFARGINSD